MTLNIMALNIIANYKKLIYDLMDNNNKLIQKLSENEQLKDVIFDKEKEIIELNCKLNYIINDNKFLKETLIEKEVHIIQLNKTINQNLSSKEKKSNK
jgi:hypothetical protein